MNDNIAMSKTNNMTIPKKQRALVLGGGGGSLSAYEVGVKSRSINRFNYEQKKFNLIMQKSLLVKRQQSQEKCRQELADKNKELEAVKSQNTIDIDEKVQQAIIDNESKHIQIETEYRLKINRIECDNKELITEAEKTQKTLDSIPPELRGTASEIVLLDTLHNAF